MKKAIIFFVLLISGIHAIFSQTLTIEGYAYLQFQSRFDSIMVILTRTEPTLITDTTFTDVDGYYKIEVYKGIFNISFFKKNFYKAEQKNLKIFDNQKIQNTTLLSAGLSGNLSGVLSKGDYLIGDTISINNHDTLKIEPGSRLFFKKNIPFIINGTLVANGTESDSIFFTRYLVSNDVADSIYWDGLHFYSNSSNSKMSFCHLTFCKSVALEINSSKTTSFKNSIISECKSQGLVCIYYANPVLSNIKLINNFSADSNFRYDYFCIYIVSCFPVLSNVEIAYTKSKNLVGVSFFNGGGILNNFYIHDNTSSAIASFDGSPILNNFTVVNNGGGISFSNGNFTVNNSIIANNNFALKGSFKVNNSCFYNNKTEFRDTAKWLGVNVTINNRGDSCDVFGNIQLDPQFVDASKGDFRLEPTSPCIDAGVNDSVKTIKDILGNSRIWDGDNNGTDIVDIGAYEYGAPFDTTKELVKEDFEKGVLAWKVTTNGNSSNDWKIINDAANSHSGNHYLRIAGNLNAQSSIITSNIITLPDTGKTHLTFWLRENYSTTQTRISKDKQLSSIIKEFSVLVNHGGDISAPVQLTKIADIKNLWNEYDIDLSQFNCEDISLSFVGNITDVSSGTQYILLDDILVSSEGEITEVNDATSVINSDFQFVISPNPASDYIDIEVPVGVQLAFPNKIEIYSIEGILMQSTSPQPSPFSEWAIQVDVSGFVPGVYFVKIWDMVQRFVKV